MLVVSDEARENLNQIFHHIAENNIDAARKTIRELSGKFDLLAANPSLGRAQDRFILNLRSFPHKKYVIFYFPIENGVEIYRVVHSSRDIETIFTDYFEGLDEQS